MTARAWCRSTIATHRAVASLLFFSLVVALDPNPKPLKP